MKKINSLTSFLSGTLVLFLASSAFLLSFDALKNLAQELGVSPSMAWLYPAIIDGAIIVFSLSVLRANLNQESALYPWILVSLFTVLSVILNIVHAPKNFLAQFLASIPPIALFLSFELLMSQLKAMAVRLRATQSLSEITKIVQEKQTELDALIANRTAELDGIVQERTGRLEKLKAETERLENKKYKSSKTNQNGQAQKRTTKKQEALQHLLTYLDSHPNASLSEMAEAIGRSKSTAGIYVSELETDKILRKDLNGWQVVNGYQ